ncbi:MAG: hypothetical protein R3B40_26045 [Polyangiales bacterium]
MGDDSEATFRYAQEALSFFTHGAACREDTTIARHMVTVGALVSREWTYRTAEDIEELLLTRATRDPKTAGHCCTRRPTRTRCAATWTTPGTRSGR